MNRKSTPTPEPIAQLQRQLEEFRSAHATRTKLPEPLWQAAVELARQHGVYPVAHPLRLDYMGLRRRLGESHSPQPKTARHQRKDTPSRHSSNWSHGIRQRLMNASSSLSLRRDGKMRIQWKATAPPDWSSLLQAWRETEG